MKKPPFYFCTKCGVILPYSSKKPFCPLCKKNDNVDVVIGYKNGIIGSGNTILGKEDDNLRR